MHLIDKQNVTGAKSYIFNSKKEIINTCTLSDSKNTIVLNDQITYHDVSTFKQIDPNKIGYRKMLLIDINPLATKNDS